LRVVLTSSAAMSSAGVSIGLQADAPPDLSVMTILPA
jgi:hypothetical protein